MDDVYASAVALLRPYALCLVLAAAGLGYAWWKGRGARRRLLGVTLPLAILVLLSLPALSLLELGSLEWQYPPLREPPEPVEALVVLSGGIRTADSVRPRAEPDEDTVYRCLYAAELYRQVGRCPVVVTGGRMNGPDAPSCAEVMRDFLTEIGVRASDITTEDGSRTTYENAVNTRRLLEPRGVRRVVLVTDAAHMYRSVRCFRKQGFEVVPAPCNFRATEFHGSLLEFVPTPGSAQRSAEACHEWGGTLWYWWCGRI